MTRQAELYELEGERRHAAELRLRISKRSFGDLHQHTFKATYVLANIYAEQGLLRVATTLQAQALSRQKATLGDDHLDTMQGMHNLAGTYLRQRRLKEAESLERRVVSVRRQILGETSTETLWAMHRLALIYHEQGRQREAQKLDNQIQQLTSKNHTSNRENSGGVLSIYKLIEQNKPVASELDQLARAALARAVSDLACEEAVSESLNSDEDSFEMRDCDSPSDPLDGVLKPQENENCISTIMPMKDVFRLLLDGGCLDLTSELDSALCPTAPYAGGRFSDVWCAVRQDRAQIAIKCLRLHTNSEGCVKNVKRAARELCYWSKANHKNVLELKGIAIFRGRLAMISPWMSNGTLYSYIWKNPGVNRWELCTQVAEGLAYIHRIGMVHGDLKAVNVLVSDEGTAKLSDFGNHILSDHSIAFAATSYIDGGTSRWMAPELLLEEDDDGIIVDRSMPADVYALGITILEVLTGQPPYSEYKTDAWVIKTVIDGTPPRRPTELSSESRFGDERWAMLLECWRKQPKSRPVAIEIQKKTGHRQSQQTLVGVEREAKWSYISAETSVSSAFISLVLHGCNDIGSRLDLSSFPEAALSGGRFGDVWRGNLLDKTKVAMKSLRLHTAGEMRSKVVKHAARELYSWSKLKHENVLELFGFAVLKEQLVMISPWMENGTLHSYTQEHPDVERWRLCLQASGGLTYIHGVKMVHGDLKAASNAALYDIQQADITAQNNILVSAEGVVKLTDFGNSVLTDLSLGFSTTCIAGGGTARWMAPELFGQEDVPEADRSMPADIYAFGMTILEVMTGRKPYSEYKREPGAILAAVQGKHPRRPDELSSQTRFGDGRWNLMVACWNMQPDHRPNAERLTAMTSITDEWWRRIANAHLAFLSACQTATGDMVLSDEAIHLAAGMLMAGYRTVIATMWPIGDQDASIVAEKFYEYMLKDGIPDSKKAARALHHAVGVLREQVGVAAYRRWAPFIHMGI
ncbi:hypothetical protein FRC12_019074 [Ceratobasidium sp. 428]|nr:hypothetical protein FRC12_019074 [Ceratobasidium sp. 428]